MKKLLLLLSISLTIVSCSDDDNSTQEIKIKTCECVEEVKEFDYLVNKADLKRVSGSETEDVIIDRIETDITDCSRNNTFKRKNWLTTKRKLNEEGTHYIVTERSYRLKCK